MAVWQYTRKIIGKMGSCEDEKTFHAIVFPFPFQGHLTPTLHLALALASRPQFSVTFVLTHFLHHAISRAADQDLDIFAASGLDIRCATIFDGFPLDFDGRGSSNEFRETLVRDFPGRADELVGRIVGSPPSTAARFFLVADSLYTWPAAVAEKHGLVNVSFWTEPATVFSVNYHLRMLMENGHFPNYTPTDSGEILINYIPGIRSISIKDLMAYIQHPNATPAITEMVIKAFEQVKKADYILCNTVQELEPEPFLALNQRQLTYAIGPVNLLDNAHKSIVENISLWPKSDCSEWLNSKPARSVLYISFGSIVQVTKHEIREIAHGLLLSRVNFIWVLRTNGDDAFPDGFLDDVKDRGLIVPWCNQGAILSNPAVGGFLTHCGWNSTLEAIWSGVPMICHPLLVDQPTNRKLVVDDWRIGINLCNKGVFNREEFTSRVESVMKGKRGVELREEVNKLGEVLRNALEIKGSSRQNLEKFVVDLMGRFP